MTARGPAGLYWVVVRASGAFTWENGTFILSVSVSVAVSVSLSHTHTLIFSKLHVSPLNSPAYIALGKFPSLLPIVVACPTYGDACHIQVINVLLQRAAIERNNYTALKTLFAQSTEIAELLTGYDKWYAFRIGRETGIWVGFDWYVRVSSSPRIALNISLGIKLSITR